MALLDLSNELLFQILSVEDFPGRRLYFVMLTCQRLNAIAMPLLYRRLRFHLPLGGPRWLQKDHSLAMYNERLALHPERASWALSAHFRYNYGMPDHWDHIFNILPRLSSLRVLKIQAGRRYGGFPTYYNEDWDVDEQRNFIRLLEPCRHLTSLRTVLVEDRRIITNEVAAFFALPNIQAMEVKRLRGYFYESLRENWLSIKPSTLVKFKVSTNILPKGKGVGFMFSTLTALKELSWTAEDPNEPALDGYWSPKDIQRAILPCQHTLVKLQLLMKIHNQHIEMPNIEFLGFSALSTVKISSRILFAPALSPTHQEQRQDRSDLVKRLPRSLEHLEITFSPDLRERESALKPVPTGPEDYEWFLDLAYSKTHYFPGLASVRLVEDTSWNFPEQIMWECPETLRGIFSMEGIALDVVLRVPRKETT